MELTPDQLAILFMDNPHLNNRKLAQLTGYSESAISIKRKYQANWTYKGTYLPFTHFNLNRSAFILKYQRVTIHEGSFDKLITNLDRLIYCLENNSGSLPDSMYKSTKYPVGLLDNLTYIKK